MQKVKAENSTRRPQSNVFRKSLTEEQGLVNFSRVSISGRQTFSVRACARTRTRAGAAIFVQIGARKC